MSDEYNGRRVQIVFSQPGSFYDINGAAKAVQLHGYLNIGHYFWFSVAGSLNVQTDPVLVGTGHNVIILSADTPAQVADKFSIAVNAVTGVFVSCHQSDSQWVIVTDEEYSFGDEDTFTGGAVADIVDIGGNSCEDEGCNNGDLSSQNYCKSFGNKIYPVECYRSTDLLGRAEAILTPTMLVNRYLKGIDLSEFTPDDLKQQINLAMNEFELMTNLSIYKQQKRERLPFDRALFKEFVFIKLNNRPVLSVEDISIVSSNGENIFRLPAQWLEVGFSHKGQINLIPILSIFGAAGLTTGQPSNAGLIFLQAINSWNWLPAFFTCCYTVGVSHTDGQVPILINDICGHFAAIRILSIKQTQFKYNSTSIGQDGISQSASGAGPQTYSTRIKDLTDEKNILIAKLKSKFSSKYFLSNI